MEFPLLASKVWFYMSTRHVTILSPIFLLHQPTSSWVYSLWFYSRPRLVRPLGVSCGRVSIRNSQITTVSSKRFAIKLKSIVRDEGMRDLEPDDNVFPEKIFGVHISDICQGLSFNPFDEIVHADQQISLVPCCFGGRANNIQASLCKWPNAGYGIKDSL